MYRPLQILTDVPGFIENKLVVNTVLKIKLVVKKCFKSQIEVSGKNSVRICTDLYRAAQTLKKPF